MVGALPGVIGSLMAMEVVKRLAGAGETLAGRLMLYDALAAEFRTLKILKSPDWPGLLICLSRLPRRTRSVVSSFAKTRKGRA